MRICIIGKYPPIEGGVSSQTYWLARGLARRGHEVHVVTNADEVEDFYRLTLEPEDGGWYQSEFANGGRVRVYNADAFSGATMGHIPESNPFVSKLAALATDVIRARRCDVILAYYFEPYAVAGWLASRWTARKLLIKHAGSDLDRLFRVPDLASTYREILRAADGVVTQPRLMPRFVGLGVARHRLHPDIPYALPQDAFNSEDAPLEFPASVPVIGIYGKVGVSKGTYDLIAALGSLAEQGVDFRLAAMIGSAQHEYIAPALARAGIAERTIALPMAANWRVPAFLRACTAVCFLERDFPVAIHGPIIPREVFACGTCLILSQEIASKQRYRDRLAADENVILVANPKDRSALADTLRAVLIDPARAAAIGAQGARLSQSLENHEVYVLGWETLLGAYAEPTSPADHVELPADFIELLPDLHAFLARTCPAVTAGFSAPARTDPFDAAVAFCEFAAVGLEGLLPPPMLARVRAVVAYARSRLAVAHIPLNPPPVFAVSDRLRGRPVTPATAGALRPVKGLSVRVEAFDFDVSAVEMLMSVGGLPGGGDDGGDLAALEPRPTLVLFHRSANLSPCELRIDPATHALIEKCTGLLTTDALIAEMCEQLGVRDPTHRDEVGARVCQALDRLYREGVLIFAEYRPGWGWLGGLRSHHPMAPSHDPEPQHRVD